MQTDHVNNMGDLLIHGLRDVAYAENQTLRILSKMAERATNEDLKETLQSHGGTTRKQIKRLALVFERLGQPFEPLGKSPAVDGLAVEAEQLRLLDKSVVDAAIIGTMHAMKQLAIARYSTLVSWARELGHTAIIRLLNTNLNDEKTANTRLNAIHLHRFVVRTGEPLKVAS